MAKESQVVKSGMWYVVSNFVLRGISFITTPIFARLLTKREYGDFSNFSSWIAILTVFITLNMESTIISAQRDYKGREKQYEKSVLSLGLIVGFVFIIITNLIPTYFENIFSMKIGYINMMYLYILGMMFVNYFLVAERFKFEYKKTVFLSAFISITSSILSILLVYFMSDKLTGRILGYIIPAILVGIIFFFLVFVNNIKIDVNIWKYALPICLPFIPHLLSLNVLNSVDRIMITNYCGSEKTAIYSMAYTCGNVITILVSALNNAYSPWLAKKLTEKDYTSIKKYSILYFMFFLIFAIGIMLITPELLLILGGKAYAESKYVMIPIAVGCVCQFAYCMYVNVEQYDKKTYGMAVASISAALLNFVLNFIFIPKFGYIAAAYTTLLGYLWLLFVHVAFVYIIKRAYVYNTKAILIMILGTVAFSIVLNYLYHSNLLRWIIICLLMITLVIACFKNKAKLLELIRR